MKLNYLGFLYNNNVTAGVGCSSSSGRLLPELGGLVSTECAGCGTGHLRLPLVSLHQQGLSTTLCFLCLLHRSVAATGNML